MGTGLLMRSAERLNSASFPKKIKNSNQVFVSERLLFNLVIMDSGCETQSQRPFLNFGGGYPLPCNVYRLACKRLAYS